jgi:D-serine deaminase-like pyridoxal phosphate-dependent protein
MSEQQHRLKGIVLPDGVPLDAVGDLGWSALTDLETPVMVLHAEALRHNIATMEAYVRDAGVLLAPHAKTSLSRYVVSAQLDGGAWGMTAATVGQVRALHRWGVRRILLANVLVDPKAIEWLARTLLATSTHSTGHDQTDLWCYVDSVAGVDLLEHTLAELHAERPLQVLVERGYDGGRTGARSREEALWTARAVQRSARLVLSGVGGYEGLMHRDPDAGHPAGLVPFLDAIAETARDLVTADLLEVEAPIVTAGGSSYFDQVVARLGPDIVGPRFRTVLRSGCYVTHDHGMYHRASPFDGRRTSPDAPTFRPALELLARVLSTPERGLAIVDFGRRDVPFDDQLPILLGRYADGVLQPLPRIPVAKVNDQHGHLRLEDGPGEEPGSQHDLAPGDLLAFGISHPCGAFDRWPAIPLVDESHRVLDVVTVDM